MIYQLSNGRIIELSVEQYLELSDEDIHELIGLSPVHSIETINPFFSPFNKKFKYRDPELDHEIEPDLFNIDSEEKRNDKDFHRDE
jgi:hypothetical protein|tara:strand:- start:301 stop:558 length:258 start_codon:yes stop_codon:yes gene_type:complete